MGSGASKTRPRKVPAKAAVGHQDEYFESHDPPQKRPTADRIRTEHEAYVRQKVDKSIERINVELTELDQQWTFVQHNGKIPEALAAVVVAETLDAIGTMYCTVQYLKAQRFETKQKLALTPFVKNRASNVTSKLTENGDQLAVEEERLEKARTALERWNLDLGPLGQMMPDTPARVASLCQSLPLAVSDPTLERPLDTNDLTVQRLMGMCVVLGKKKHATSALTVYNRRRANATTGLVAVILEDISSYNRVYADLMENPECLEALLKLDELTTRAPEPFGESGEPLTVAAAERLVGSSASADMPKSAKVDYAIYMRKVAALGSIALYNKVCDTVLGVTMTGISPSYVVPGGVKKLDRTVYKTVTKYHCDFLQCRDLIRCTVVTTSITAVAAIVEGIFDSDDIHVVRVKNRYDREYDAKPAGGYRDFQMLVLFKDDAGKWLFGEVQVNLQKMVDIKSRAGGGHAMYKFARSLAAFDEKVYTHSGNWSKAACKQISAGVLMSVDMQGGLVGTMVKRAADLADSLTSAMCRVQHLNLKFNDLGAKCATELADALRTNKSVVTIDLGNNSIGPEGAAAFAEAIKVNKHITSLDMSNNKLGDEGGTALAEGLRLNKTLTNLKLNYNGFKSTTEQMIRQAWGTRKGQLTLASDEDAHTKDNFKPTVGGITKFCKTLMV
eukprot:m.182027 g.182027  ORF g.182027 m.182027 type:complete len:673 (-) comp15414_c0_seq1:375-2393(-)